MFDLQRLNYMYDVHDYSVFYDIYKNTIKPKKTCLK